MRRPRRFESRSLLIASALFVALAIGTTVIDHFGTQGTDAAARMMAGGTPDHLTIRLRAIGESEVSGKATLRAENGVTSIAIRIAGPDKIYPVHVHEGTCRDFDAMPGFPLTDATTRETTRTTVDISLGDLLHGDFVINIHRPTEDLAPMLDPDSVIACGAIEIKDVTVLPDDEEAVTTWPLTGIGPVSDDESVAPAEIALAAAAVTLALVGSLARVIERGQTSHSMV